MTTLFSNESTDAQEGAPISIPIDAVVMLLASNWKTAFARSPYQYAVRFSALYPVIFVDPTLDTPTYAYETTDLMGVVILRIYQEFGPFQTALLANALNEKGIISPLLWIYNPYFSDYIYHAYSPYKMFHLTDNYFSMAYLAILPEAFTMALIDALHAADSVVCDSVGIMNGLVGRNFKWEAKAILLTTGCDETLYCNKRGLSKTLNESIHSIPSDGRGPDDKPDIKTALQIAYQKAYDSLFSELIHRINAAIHCKPTIKKKLNILVLYEKKSMNVTAIHDHLDSFSRYSRHAITYAIGTSDQDEIPSLNSYDAVIIHYSLRLSIENSNWTLSDKAKNMLQSYTGLKVVFIQDEYDTTNIAIQWMQTLGIQLVFTCVPKHYIRHVYPVEKLPQVTFITNLTGYVPESLIHYPIKRIADRQTVIAYRGRNLPYWYGALGQEKGFIGKRMKDFCIKKAIPHDIEWDDSKRIYGDNWHQFLASAKATLGTESGANVIDFDGSISKNIIDYLAENPTASFSDASQRFIGNAEGYVKMNQISPKIFEAICLHTALILFEGDYSGVVEPHTHYIPLKKDFSNIEEVLEKVQNDAYLEHLTTRAFQDIVLSGKYSYQSFVDMVDESINVLV